MSGGAVDSKVAVQLQPDAATKRYEMQNVRLIQAVDLLKSNMPNPGYLQDRAEGWRNDEEQAVDRIPNDLRESYFQALKAAAEFAGRCFAAD